ncbi:FGGY-family carbohydrate kinase [Octadecabacter sp. G9-8]|uniref:FGGY-family carbohydrate kinase n=1 Tax=Octadecabacter dasysiphoniae TaxID=2909341 RepID=A0ABS9CRI2_9RHOB|nr:FGGY-family carbohydrate kinase [Octadecabacter dasysiphoniae]MCF2869839.1 FGGY-family carbohydrate kinase [Octadecabacter dasysiphoniae]
MTQLSLGLDLGTSGVRSAVLDDAGNVVSMARAPYPATDPDNIDAMAWWHGAAACLAAQMETLRADGHDPRTIKRIGVDGTSGSMVLCAADLTPVTRGLMYNSGGFNAQADAIAALAPDPHITRGTSSAAARALYLVSQDTDNRARHLLHQADFIAAKLMGRGGFSDHNNALKTGFDPDTNAWPAWFETAGLPANLLPDVLPAGTPVHPIAATIATTFGFADDVMIHVGTTDSIAAFLAAAPLQIGAAVTSIGTTLAVKLLSDVRIDAPDIGLYSHRLGDGWLVGGASNTGGGVLASLFTVPQLVDLSKQIDPTHASALDYYPLTTPGERFPINDPSLAPRMTPRPADDAEFLHGLFESIARIEARCYAEMAARGAPAPVSLVTAGGGASNDVWTAIRARVMGRDIAQADHTDAAIGTARLILANAQ